jgi:muramoyltetrapeptide carboxypeptidase LdcA involved in peptidoglycan recycling
VFEAGKAQLAAFGFRFREFPTTRWTAGELDRNPAARAADFHAAWQDPEVEGIVASIGGNDAIRLLPFLDGALARKHPKMVMGYSDATAYLTWLAGQGVVSYYGNTVMSGWPQMASFPPAMDWHRQFFAGEVPALQPFPFWTQGYRDWSSSASQILPPQPNLGFTWLGGAATTRGRLWGGCFEVLEMLKGTRWWPAPEFWNSRVLFLETSEEKPSPRQVMYWLRNYGAMGVFGQLSALWIGRPKDYTDAEKAELRRVVAGVVGEEWGAPQLPVVMDLDFGHTDPRWVLPLGLEVETNPTARALRFTEPLFSDPHP